MGESDTNATSRFWGNNNFPFGNNFPFHGGNTGNLPSNTGNFPFGNNFPFNAGNTGNLPSNTGNTGNLPSNTGNFPWGNTGNFPWNADATGNPFGCKAGCSYQVSFNNGARNTVCNQASGKCSLTEAKLKEEVCQSTTACTLSCNNC